MKPPPLSKYTHALLLASPTHFVGQLQSQHFDLNHAWPRGDHWEPNPASPLHYSFFALSFLSKERPEDHGKFVVLPHFAFVGDYFCVILSALFGKRFQNLGFLETNGSRWVPDLPALRPCRQRGLLSFSSRPRKDLGVDLNLSAAAIAMKLLDAVFLEIDGTERASDSIELAFTAGRFYLQALDLLEEDPELSYLSLVNAGEVLAGALDYADNELFDPELRNILEEISGGLGAAKANIIRSRLFQVRRKFRLGLTRLLAPAFFAGYECQDGWAAIKPDDVGAALNAAYDLRSKFLHTGARFRQLGCSTPESERRASRGQTGGRFRGMEGRSLPNAHPCRAREDHQILSPQLHSSEDRSIDREAGISPDRGH